MKGRNQFQYKHWVFSRYVMVCFTKQPHIYLKTRTQLKPVQSTDAELNISNTSDSK